MILLIDNYDSFTYNLYQQAGSICPDIKVIRNDELTLAQIEQLSPDYILLSPGPGRPEKAGVSMQVATTLSQRIPTLGVCVGHQAICAAFGGVVTYAGRLMHGKQSKIAQHEASEIFENCPSEFLVARYHSLIVQNETLPNCFKITAATARGEIMAVQHKEYPLYGVQFHPESIMTPQGKQIMKNFLKLTKAGEKID